LECIPAEWERALGIRPTGLTAAQLFWHLHRAPELPDRRLALEHSFRIAAFARAIFAWAERRLLNDAQSSPHSTIWPRVVRNSLDAPLPYLDLDVDFLESDGQVFLARLNEFDDPLSLSPREFAITLMFDGVTTAREAEILVCGACADDVERRIVDGVVSRVAQAGLSVLV
jgi:hypothetical protein